MNALQRLSLRYASKKGRYWDEQKLIGGFFNKEKKFYVIRRVYKNIGFFSIFLTSLGQIKYAIENNYIPVIDMMNYPNGYLAEDEVKKVNAWDRYFCQPTEFSLKEAYHSKNIILSDGIKLKEWPHDTMDLLQDKNGELSKWRILCRKYIHFNEEMKNSIEKEYTDLIKDGDRVLGVLARGTDYRKLKPSGHPIQPETRDIIIKSEEVMREYKCNKIFLATEDIEIAREFETYFKEAYITNKKEYVSYEQGNTVNCRITREKDEYLRGKEYITTIAILAKCNCLVAGRTSGTVGAALLSDGWEYSYFFDLGIYK